MVELACPRFTVLVNALDGRYQSDVLRGIRAEMEDKAALSVVVPCLSNDERDAAARVHEVLPDPASTDGIIILSGTFGFKEDDVKRIAARYDTGLASAPRVVSVGVATPHAPAITVDDGTGISEAVKHLLEEHGFTSIAFLCGPSGNAEATRRLDAYRRALPKELFRPHFVVEGGDFSCRSGREATADLLRRWPTVQAIIAANDEMARGALFAVESMCPDRNKPAVVGFDDTAYAEATLPALTTVRQPLEDEGRLAARSILELFRKGALPQQHQVLPTKLQIRESCGCLGSAKSRARPGLREVKAWVSQLVPDSVLVGRIVREFIDPFRRDSWEAEFDSVARNASERLGRRLEGATRSDIGVWERALLALRNVSLRLFSMHAERRAAVDRFWIDLIEKVSRTGSRLNLRAEDQQRQLMDLRDELLAATTPAEADPVLRRSLQPLGIAQYSFQVEGAQNTPTEPGSDSTHDDASSAAGLPTAPTATVDYALEWNGSRGHLVLVLGEPSDWWLYSEVATSLSRALSGALARDRDSCEPASRAPARDSLPSPRRPRSRDDVSSHPRLVLDLTECKETATTYLNDLSAAVHCSAASIQLVAGDARMIFVASGFSESESNRTLLRPISIDPLVRRVVDSGQPCINPDIRSDPDWSPRSVGDREIVTWIGAPVFHDKGLVGFVTLDFVDNLDRSIDYRPYVDRFAAHVAPVLAQALPLVREKQLADVALIVKQTIRLAGQNLNPHELLQTIVDAVARHLNCSHCTILQPHKQEGQVQLVAEHRSASAPVGSRTFARRETPSGWAFEGVAGWVFDKGESVLLSNAKTDPRFVPGSATGEGARSMLVVPIKTGDQTIGVISADQDVQDWFNEDDRQLVEALAEQAGIAIQLSRAVEFLQGIAASILTIENTRKIMEMVVDRAVSLMNATTGVIYHLTEDHLEVHASFPPMEFAYPPPRLDKEDGLTRTIIRGRRPLPIKDIAADPRVNPVLHGKFKSMIGVPLLIEQRVIGVLFVDDEEEHDFNELEVSLLSTLASQAAIALQKATILGERNAQVERHNRLELQLQRLHNIVQAPNLARLLDTVLEGISVILGEQVSSTVNLYDESKDDFVQCHAYGPLADRLRAPPRADGTGRYVLREKQPVYHSDIDRPPAASPAVRPEARANGIKSFAAVPMINQDFVAGVLFVNSQKKLEFAQDERLVLELFASQAAIAISNNRELQARHRAVATGAARRVNGLMTAFAGIELALREEAQDVAPDRDRLRTIHAKLRSTTADVKRLLFEFERFGDTPEPARRSASLNDVLKRVLDEFREESERTEITLDAALSPDVPLDMEFDETLMAQCVRHVLANALRYVRKRRSYNIVRVSTDIADNRVVLRIEDSGPGFPPDVDVDKLFVGTEPERAGIGLALAKDIVLKHGGEWTLGASEALGGAAVEVRLQAQ